MLRAPIIVPLAVLVLIGVTATASAADLVTLSPQTRDRYVPDGKEVDAIHGDFALANDQLVAIVAHPKRGRNANMTVREVGGCLIDLTRRDRPSDQLSVFYPGAQSRALRFGGIEVEAPEIYETAELDRVFVKARRVTLRLVAIPAEQAPDVEVAYTLQDGWPYVLVTTTFANRGDRAVDADLLDSIRADRTFERCPEGPLDLFWIDDRHFGQAYGILAEGHQVRSASARTMLLRYQNREGKVAVRLEPGATYRLTRRIIPGDDTFEVRSIANRLASRPSRPATVTVRTGGRPVAGAEVRLERDGAIVARGRTDADGTLVVDLGQGPGMLTVSELSRGSIAREVGPGAIEALTFDLPEPGVVVAQITDDRDGPVPCKVQFTGRGDTPTPDFGPDSGEIAVKNLYYSHDGKFRRELAPGSYDVIVSHGPEYDAVFTTIDVARGRESRLQATLARSVRTDGWISSDFHSHSSPSGDNTSSQFGRVLNLLCEHIEGEDLSAPGGEATLHVRVQCPNWFDVDRVQVFVNGRPVDSLNFTRKQSPNRFSGNAVKFDQEIPIHLEGDAHVIVAAIGEESRLGPVMGPEHDDDRPVAVTNPIFVDVDGGGFKANGDPLGKLPVKGGR